MEGASEYMSRVSRCHPDTRQLNSIVESRSHTGNSPNVKQEIGNSSSKQL